jgi:hypothetical protein
MKFEVGQHVIMKGQGPLWGRRRVISEVLDPGYYAIAHLDNMTETCHIAHESDLIPEEPVQPPGQHGKIETPEPIMKNETTHDLLDRAMCNEALAFLRRISALENDDLWAFARLIAETKLPPGTTGTTLGDVFHSARNMTFLDDAQHMIYNFNEGE